MTHRANGIALAAFALLLLGFAAPQMITGWLTAPENLDHVHAVMLTPERAARFERSLKILPQADTTRALTYAYLHTGPLPTLQRNMVQQAAIRAVRLSPGDAYNWYYLAAALENEIFDPARRALFDQALTMALLTGPHTRELMVPIAMTVVKHWPQLSQPLHGAWQNQIISLWAASPQDLRALYLALPPAGQKLIFATLNEIPGETLHFNQYLDHPGQPPPEPAEDSRDADDE